MRSRVQRRGGLERKCPTCKRWRKYHEPPGDQGGEYHPRRPPWRKVGEQVICGWCAMRAAGANTFTQDGVTRDVKTGRVIERKPCSTPHGT